MKKILKRFSLIGAIIINMSIVFAKSVFADVAIPSNVLDNEKESILIYIIIATILSLLIGIIFMIVVNKVSSKYVDEDKEENIEEDKKK